MSWFNDLIEERKKKNQDIFESSFNNISASVFSGSSKEKGPYHFALEQIFKYYHIDRVDIPEKFNDFTKELDLLLEKHNLLTRPIKLEGYWQKENSEPIIAFTKQSRTPVVLFPRGESIYYYINPQNGKKTWVTLQVLVLFEVEAISFYRPLPKHKMGIKDYLNYILQNIRISDAILVTVLVVIVVGVGMINPYLMRILTGEVINNQDYQLFLSTALYMTGAGVAVLLIKTTQAIVNARVSLRVDHSIHSATMMKLLSLPTSFFKKYNTGELNARLNSSTTLCYLIINGIFIGGLSSILSLLYLIQIANFSTALILPSLGVVLVNLLFMILVSVLERKVMRRQTRLSAKESGVSYDLIKGIQKIRLTGSEKRAFAKWADIYTPAARASYNPPLIVKLSPVFTVLISVAGSILIYYLVAKNNLDSATYVAFNSSYGALSGALLALSGIVSNAVKIKPLLEMVSPILEEEPENSADKVIVEKIDGNIKLDHVSFRYGEDLPMVLDDLSLDIKSGEYVAIVGKTGCGKTTIVRLLLGFEKPSRGNIYYDNHNINDVDLPSLRTKIGSVTQNGSLFHADILSNIIISAPNLEEKDAWEAARIANIADDIKKMPMKMNTIISEGQGSISGGQKQRIMIARAIVHKPKIIIFDEATSALDNQCQKEVSDSIAELNCTRIVIAHRLSTIKQCDRILYLENGKVVEEGNYDELIALNGRFKELVERQKIE